MITFNKFFIFLPFPTYIITLAKQLLLKEIRSARKSDITLNKETKGIVEGFY